MEHHWLSSHQKAWGEGFLASQALWTCLVEGRCSSGLDPGLCKHGVADGTLGFTTCPPTLKNEGMSPQNWVIKGADIWRWANGLSTSETGEDLNGNVQAWKRATVYWCSVSIHCMPKAYKQQQCNYSILSPYHGAMPLLQAYRGSWWR